MVSEKFLDTVPQEPADHLLGLCRASKQPNSATREDLAAILSLLRAGTGHDCSQYKASAILRAVHSRMACCDSATIESYTGYLERHPEEVQILFKALLISVTSFFRDAAAFASLKRDALFPLLRERPRGSVVRAWVPGCATGEEAYSLAVLLQEAAEEVQQRCVCRILATDINEQAVEVARAGIFPPSIEGHVSPGRLERFFTRHEQSYKVGAETRAMVAFGLQSVITHAPVIQVDLISCRNLLIYLEPDLQDALITSFHRALRPGGVLFLSPSESIGSHIALFTPINRKWKLYRANSLCPAMDAGSSLLTQAPDSGS